MQRIVPILFLAFLCHYADCNSRLIEDQKTLNRILDSESYDKRIRAFGESGTEPTVVNVNLYVRSIDSLDDKKMEYSTQLTFRMEWLDTRLKYNSSNENNRTYLTLTDTTQIWTPDLFFSNEKEGKFHDLLAPNTYVRIWPSGSVLLSQRISLKLSCPMMMQYYPMDTQTCSLRMASYGWTTDDIIFKWKTADPVQVTTNLHLPRFSLEQFTTDHCDSTTNTGTYSCLRLDLELKRELSFYLLQVYIPCTMLVIIAWLSFWINSTKVVARIIVTLVTLLVLAIQVSEFNATLPPVSYTKAIDVWTGICLTFVFSAFVEFIVVHYLSQGEESNREKQHGPNSTDGLPEEKAIMKVGPKSLKHIFDSAPDYKKIDIAARIIYPFLFLFFNVIYWPSYK